MNHHIGKTRRANLSENRNNATVARLEERVVKLEQSSLETFE